MALVLLTLADIKSHIRLENSAANAYLTLLGESIEAYIADLLGVAWEEKVITGEKVASGPRILPVLFHPIISIEEIRGVYPSGSVIPEGEYQSSKYGVERRWEHGRWDNVEYEIDYTAGFNEDVPIPPQLKVVALQIIASTYRNQDGRQGEGNKGGSVTWNNMLTDGQKLILEGCSYRSMF